MWRPNSSVTGRATNAGMDGSCSRREALLRVYPAVSDLAQFSAPPPRDATPGKVMITSDSPMHPFDLRSYPDLSKTDNQLLIIDDPREMRFQSISLSCVI